MNKRPTPYSDSQWPSLRNMPDDTAVWATLGTIRNLERQRDGLREALEAIASHPIATWQVQEIAEDAIEFIGGTEQ